MFRDSILEQDLIPFETTDLVGKKVLVFAPHPDDETLGCAGAIIRHLENGDKVKVVFLTDGRGGDFSGEYNVEEYVKIRENEARRASELLGVSDLYFCQFEDRNLGRSADHYSKVKEITIEYGPELIYVTSPIEINPDHRSAARIIWKLICETGMQVDVAFYEISTPLQANALVDISGQTEQKKQAASCYSSQMHSINYLEMALAMNRFRSLTIASKAQYAEAFFIIKSAEMCRKKISDFFSIRKRMKIDDAEFMPKVSIIVRTKDRPELLKDALRSLAEQHYKNIEVVVVNDGGVDIGDIVSLFDDQINIVNLINEQSQGRSAAANLGLLASTGDYIGLLDDDDILYPDHLELLVNEISLNRDLQFVYSDCRINRYESSGSDYINKIPSTSSVYKAINFNRDKLFQMNFIPIMTALFSRDLLEKTNYFDESLDVFEDWDLWIQMSMFADFKRINRVTCDYRIFGERNYNYLEGQIKIYEKYWHICTPHKIIEWLHEAQGENEILKEKLEIISTDSSYPGK